MARLINFPGRGTQHGLTIKRQRNNIISKTEQFSESFRGDMKPSLDSERLRGSLIEATTSGRGSEVMTVSLFHVF